MGSPKPTVPLIFSSFFFLRQTLGKCRKDRIRIISGKKGSIADLPRLFPRIFSRIWLDIEPVSLADHHSPTFAIGHLRRPNARIRVDRAAKCGIRRRHTLIRIKNICSGTCRIVTTGSNASHFWCRILVIKVAISKKISPRGANESCDGCSHCDCVLFIIHPKIFIESIKSRVFSHVGQKPKCPGNRMLVCVVTTHGVMLFGYCILQACQPDLLKIAFTLCESRCFTHRCKSWK